MSSSDATVYTEIETRASGGRIARVTVAGAGRLNVLNTAQIERLIDAFERLAGDDDLRVAVLTGAGERAFIGGADLNELKTLDRESAGAFISGLERACRTIRALPVPVIARVNGYCLGGGLEVAASCDLRIAADTAVFGMPEVKVSIPSVIEAALLPGLIGWGKTREVLLTGENFPAAEAFRIGLVERVAPAGKLDAALAAWIDAICAAGPRAVRAQKALIANWERSSLEDGIMAGVDALAEAYATDEPRRMMQAFFDRKARGS